MPFHARKAASCSSILVFDWNYTLVTRANLIQNDAFWHIWRRPCPGLILLNMIEPFHFSLSNVQQYLRVKNSNELLGVNYWWNLLQGNGDTKLWISNLFPRRTSINKWLHCEVLHTFLKTVCWKGAIGQFQSQHMSGHNRSPKWRCSQPFVGCFRGCSSSSCGKRPQMITQSSLSVSSFTGRCTSATLFTSSNIWPKTLRTHCWPCLWRVR